MICRVIFTWPESNGIAAPTPADFRKRICPNYAWSGFVAGHVPDIALKDFARSSGRSSTFVAERQRFPRGRVRRTMQISSHSAGMFRSIIRVASATTRSDWA